MLTMVYYVNLQFVIYLYYTIYSVLLIPQALYVEDKVCYVNQLALCKPERKKEI